MDDIRLNIKNVCATGELFVYVITRGLVGKLSDNFHN